MKGSLSIDLTRCASLFGISDSVKLEDSKTESGDGFSEKDTREASGMGCRDVAS